ncbi:MAG: capsule biosynthesis protein CapA [Pseudomonadota bacterium]
MMAHRPRNRVFLFLQGPHGPFFAGLGAMLRKTGAAVWRVGFNAGDRAFWRDHQDYIAYRGTSATWPGTFGDILSDKHVTDLVIYGDSRPHHAQAIKLAKARGITVHVFEEGYLRPYWITYERDGSNGNSRLMQMDVSDMQAALAQSDFETALPPGHWGDMRHHIFYGALYHGFVLLMNRRYRQMPSHRALPVSAEFKLYLKRLLLMPFLALDRLWATRRIRRGGFPYHLALLQLEHDSAFAAHTPFGSTGDFLAEVIRGFAQGAPAHHHLVIKAHPLEDGRVPLRRLLRGHAQAAGIADRVHFVRGGKLAKLLDEARSAVTANSTSGQQVLWRGIPLKTFGAAVYAKPEFVSSQAVSQFFAAPARPDTKAYREYRRYLLETSQVPGGFYAARGRRQLFRHVIDMMLDDADPYDAFSAGTAAPRQQLRLVT